MSRSPRRVLCGILIAGGALTGTAVAATPENGEVSAASPKVSWTGATTAGYLLRMPTAVSGSEETPCEAPFCDQFALKVSTSATLTIAEQLATDSETAAATIRITKPDGSVMQADTDPGAASNKYFKMVIKNAPVGDYTIEHYDNAAAGTEFDAYAELAVPSAAPAAVTPAAPPPAAVVEAIDVQVKAAAASAHRLAKTRKLAAKVTVSRAVTSIAGTLKKGSKTFGTGRLGATSGTARLAIKTAKKLKPGTYTLSVVARDASSMAAKSIKVKVKK